MKNKRNTYIISKALKGFVLASVLTAAASQLGSTLDAIALAQFEGEEAVSALSLVLPVTTLISCMGLLMAFGANALVAREIGSHQLKNVSNIFSTAIWSVLTIGVVCAILMYAGIPFILTLITDEASLRTLPAAYLRVFVPGAWLEMLSYALSLFVATDGHPRLVTKAVMAGVLVNAVVDVWTVGFLEWGIQGVAWGSLAQFAVNSLLLALYLRHPACSYRLMWPGRKVFGLLIANIKEGAAVTIGNILMAVTVLLISNLIFNASGDRGLFFWSVCLQMLLVAVVFINGVMEALFAIGGVMLGEHDLSGFHLLTRRALVTLSLAIALIIILMTIPGAVGLLFGVEDPQEMAALDHVLRIFSLLLLPFAVTLVLMAVYQILERIILSIICVVCQLATLIITIGLFATYGPSLVWWGFPVASILFLLAQLLWSFVSSRRQGCRVSALTQIPYSEGGQTFDRSVPYQPEANVQTVLAEIESFLQSTTLSAPHILRLTRYCEQVITNMVHHAQGPVVQHSFDVHIYANKQALCIALKDGGKPFNPLPATDCMNTVSYKYMYGLNIVLIK